MHRLRDAYRMIFHGDGVFADRRAAAREVFAADPLVGKVIAFIDSRRKRPLMMPRRTHVAARGREAAATEDGSEAHE
jgi:UDP-N-acetylglucosamine acyltransferase